MSTTWAKFAWDDRRKRWVFRGFTYYRPDVEIFTTECLEDGYASTVVPLEDPLIVPRTVNVPVNGELL